MDGEQFDIAKDRNSLGENGDNDGFVKLEEITGANFGTFCFNIYQHFHFLSLNGHTGANGVWLKVS